MRRKSVVRDQHSLTSDPGGYFPFCVVRFWSEKEGGTERHERVTPGLRRDGSNQER